MNLFGLLYLTQYTAQCSITTKLSIEKKMSGICGNHNHLAINKLAIESKSAFAAELIQALTLSYWCDTGSNNVVYLVEVKSNQIRF